jgi:hypothetical protein
VKTKPAAILVFLAVLSCAPFASAHPGSALVIDQQTNVYFAYWGGTWKLDLTGKLTRIHSNDFHWLAIDLTGRFAKAETPFLRITPHGAAPALFSFPNYPATFHTGGNLYLAPWVPGRIRLERMTPDGAQTRFVDVAISPNVARKSGRHEGGLLAIASGANQLLYVSDGASIWKISERGVISTLVENITVPDCPNDLPAELPKPHIRGLALGTDDDLFAAAIGCRCVLRITPSGKISVALRSEAPWSPCAVSVAKVDVYVMEYDNPLAEWPHEGRPRLRKLTADGRVTTLAVMEKAAPK